MTHILVVSNDVARLTDTLSVLGHAGYHARGASTFAEARHRLAGSPPDLVIADQRLGEYNGLHVILRARAKHPDLSAIVTTGATDRGLEADAMSLGVECVLKPKTAKGWLAPVERVLSHHRVDRFPAIRRQHRRAVTSRDLEPAAACA
jgi:DNA-binding NtrC family response regulator